MSFHQYFERALKRRLNWNGTRWALPKINPLPPESVSGSEGTVTHLIPVQAPWTVDGEGGVDTTQPANTVLPSAASAELNGGTEVKSFYRIRSRHGTWLAEDTRSGEIVCCDEDRADSRLRPLVAYVPALHADVCFLIANSMGSGSLVMQPDLDCEALLPLGLAPHGAAQTVSLYHPDTSKWVSAAPVTDGAGFAQVTANADKIQMWEEFDVVPVGSAFVSPETLSLVRRLDMLLTAPLGIEMVLGLTSEDAPILQAIARTVPLAQLGRLARSLLGSPEACRKLAELFPKDLLGTLGLPFLAAWVAQQNGQSGRMPAVPQARHIALSTELDPLAELGVKGEYVSFPYACTVMARRAVEPRYNVCVIATARNEGLYLLEWIAYHRAIGIEAFFLSTNDNDDGSDNLLAALERAGVIHWTDNKVAPGGSAQPKAYAHALAIRPEVLDYRWALVIDLDEYMVLNPAVFRSVQAYLRWQEASPVDAIGLNWIFHGSSGAARWHDDFIVRRFPSPIGGVNPHIKTLLRPRKFINSQPHHPLTYRRQPFVFKNSSGGPHVPHATVGSAWSEAPVAEYAWINHYFYKSSEEFLLKWSRNRGDFPVTRGPVNTALSAGFVRQFMDQFSITGTAPVDPEAAAPGFMAELASLMSLPSVADAFDLVKQVYHSRMKEIIPMFLDAPGILEAGSAGEAFLNTLGFSRRRIPLPAAVPADQSLYEPDILFDEEWYLLRYPDVAAAVQAGHGQSGLQHYLARGRKEGRLPVPPEQNS